MSSPTARDRLFEHIREALQSGALLKLTLGKYRGPDSTLRNVFVRPVSLKDGPHAAFVWRHATRDITKNFTLDAAVAEIDSLVRPDSFLDAHLFTAAQTVQFESQPNGSARLRIKAAQPVDGAEPRPAPATHDAAKRYTIPADAGWLRALGVTNDRNQPREGMADKFRQIQKFAEVLSHLLDEAGLPAPGAAPLEIVDMGSGKGYLTFAVAALLGDRAKIRGVEARPELVSLCNKVAAEQGLFGGLSFSAGSIADASLTGCDVLIALHACDTATDDALARGIGAGARLLVVSPCCQKELRKQIKAPPVLAEPMRHGIFQERQSEFVTDALRALLLEWSGYRTKVFEFISTEHTARNLMISAVKEREAASNAQREARGLRVRELAAFYGIHTQHLASHLGFSLEQPRNFVPQSEP